MQPYIQYSSLNNKFHSNLLCIHLGFLCNAMDAIMFSEQNMLLSLCFPLSLSFHLGRSVWTFISKSIRKNVYSFDFEFVSGNKRSGQRCTEQLQWTFNFYFSRKKNRRKRRLNSVTVLPFRIVHWREKVRLNSRYRRILSDHRCVKISADDINFCFFSHPLLRA